MFERFTVGELVRPLAYAMCSNPIVAVCNRDLSYNHGGFGAQMQVSIGRPVTRRLMTEYR